MEILTQAFNTILYQPLVNALVLLYQHIPGKDFGIAIIMLTLITRVLLYPLMLKSLKSQREMAELQPKMQEIQKKYKDDKEGQAKALVELYQKEKINPMGGCLPFLVQFPLLIALYRVFWKGLDPSTMKYLYSFVANPGTINPVSFGFLNLAQPNLVLAVAAGVLQYIQTKMFTPRQTSQKGGGGMFGDMMQKQLLYFFPVITVLILMKMPSAIGLYWIVTSLFSIGQQYLILKKKNESAKI